MRISQRKVYDGRGQTRVLDLAIAGQLSFSLLAWDSSGCKHCGSFPTAKQAMASAISRMRDGCKKPYISVNARGYGSGEAVILRWRGGRWRSQKQLAELKAAV